MGNGEPFRLQVEAAFNLPGRGTAALGVILEGQLRVGDELSIEGTQGPSAACRAIDGAPRALRTLEDGRPRVVVIVPAWDATDLKAGDVLTSALPEAH